MTAHAALAIEASGLVKVFGKSRAVDGVDLVVPTGGVYGFLGPNGAGKTTTIRMLATLLRPDAERAAHALLALSRAGVAVADFSLGQPSLDEVFLALTGRPAQDDTAAEDAA